MDFEYHKVRMDKMWGIAIDYYNGLDSYVKIPQNIIGLPVVVINNLAFNDCTSVESITIPASIKDIGYFAFKGCPNLKIIKIPLRIKSFLESEAMISLRNIGIPIQYYGGSLQILLQIEKFKNVSTASLVNPMLLNELKNLLESEDYFGKLDNEVSNILNDIFKSQSLVNLGILLNALSKNSTIDFNCNFNTNINEKLMELINKVSKFNDEQAEHRRQEQIRKQQEELKRREEKRKQEEELQRQENLQRQQEERQKAEEYRAYNDLMNFIVQLRDEYRNLPNIYFANSGEKADEKILNAIYSYASEAKYETVIFDFDSTFFGNATEGFLITDKKIYIAEMFSDKMILSLEQIYSLKLTYSPA